MDRSRLDEMPGRGGGDGLKYGLIIEWGDLRTGYPALTLYISSILQAEQMENKGRWVSKKESVGRSWNR